MDMIRHASSPRRDSRLNLQALPRGRGSAPHGLELCAVNDAGETVAAIEASAPKLVVASGDRALRTGSHLGGGGGIDRPGLAPIGGEVNAPDVRVDVPASGPTRRAGQEQDGTNRPWAVESPATPGLAAVGGEMDPAFHIGRNFAAANPAPAVVQKEDGTIKNGINRIAAVPLRAAREAGAEVDARCARVKVSEQRKLGIEPRARGIVDRAAPVGKHRAAVGRVLGVCHRIAAREFHDDAILPLDEPDTLQPRGPKTHVARPGLATIVTPAQNAIRVARIVEAGDDDIFGRDRVDAVEVIATASTQYLRPVTSAVGGFPDQAEFSSGVTNLGGGEGDIVNNRSWQGGE